MEQFKEGTQVNAFYSNDDTGFDIVVDDRSFSRDVYQTVFVTYAQVEAALARDTPAVKMEEFRSYQFCAQRRIVVSLFNRGLLGQPV